MLGLVQIKPEENGYLKVNLDGKRTSAKAFFYNSLCLSPRIGLTNDRSKASLRLKKQHGKWLERRRRICIHRRKADLALKFF